MSIIYELENKCCWWVPVQYEDTLFRAHQTSGRFVFRGSSFLCHHWPLLLIFLEAAQLSVLFILSGRIGVGVDWVGSHPPFEQLTKKLYRNIIRAFHKLLEIFQNVSRNFLRSCSKVAQNTIKSCFFKRKLLEKTKLFWSGAKICKLYNKSKISKHFCAILRLNQHCQITLSSIRTKNWPFRSCVGNWGEFQI